MNNRQLIFLLFLFAAGATTAQTYGLSGRLLSPRGQPRAGLAITAVDSTGAIIAATMSDADGAYAFPALAPGAYRLRLGTPGDDLRGVSTFDRVLLMRHLLGTEHLDSPYAILAADVDGSGQISLLDGLFIARLVIGIDPLFPLASWRLVPAGLIFGDPGNPFPDLAGGDFIDLTGERRGIDFIVVKLGDLNFSF